VLRSLVMRRALWHAGNNPCFFPWFTTAFHSTQFSGTTKWPGCAAMDSNSTAPLQSKPLRRRTSIHCRFLLKHTSERGGISQKLLHVIWQEWYWFSVHTSSFIHCCFVIYHPCILLWPRSQTTNYSVHRNAVYEVPVCSGSLLSSSSMSNSDSLSSYSTFSSSSLKSGAKALQFS